MSCLRNQEGMALLLVLVVVALLSAVVIEFSFSTLVDLRASETYRDRTKAYYIARGGVEAARTILAEDNNEYDHPGEFWGNPLVNIPVGDGDVSISTQDLTGRMNINFVADNRGNPLSGYHRFVALCEEVLQLDQFEAMALADSLIYWYNGDSSVVTPDDEYYSNLHPPYMRRGAKLTTLDELKLVKGFSQERFNLLQPFIRVVGDEQININTVSAEVLHAWQSSAAEGNVEIVFDRYDIDAIVTYRQKSAFEEIADVAMVENIGDRWSAAWVQGSVVVSGATYLVVSEGRIGQVIRAAQAIIKKNGNEVLSFKVE